MHELNYRWVYETNGEPLKVLRLEKSEIAKELKDEEVRIGLVCANINPSDFGLIQGTYGRKNALPSVGGREGAGVVLKCGKGVTRVKEGDKVRMPEDKGTWQSYCTVEEKELFLPKIPTTLPDYLAGTAFINPPTAFRLLHDFGELKEGDWIIQNAANSAVGLHVLQIAEHLKMNTINVVRDKRSREPLLKKFGAEVVIEEGEKLTGLVPEVSGGKKPKLGLNSVGGESAYRMIQVLENNGRLVTFGGISKQDPIPFPTRYLIFNNIQLQGFWMDSWMRMQTQEEIEKLFNVLFKWMEEGVLQVEVDTVYGLEDLDKAIEHAGSSKRNGKILVKGPYWKD